MGFKNKALYFDEYSAEYHKLLMLIWAESGYCKPHWTNPSWIKFKLVQYDFYLKEIGCGLYYLLLLNPHAIIATK